MADSRVTAVRQARDMRRMANVQAATLEYMKSIEAYLARMNGCEPLDAAAIIEQTEEEDTPIHVFP